uniref:Transcription activation suppressor family member 2 n=1 Tax=Buteo japonicus TaxID=224669 RepID=A0A8C0BMC9_9AVES
NRELVFLLPKGSFHLESEESSSLLQTAVSVLQSSYLDSTSQDGFQYSQAILVENHVFLSEVRPVEEQGVAGSLGKGGRLSLLLKAKEVCQTGLRVNSSSISILGDPAKGVYISKYADCLHPRPWYHGKSGYIVICKLIKYYVYEVSDGSTAERPRQICPYIVIACQYREPKEMPDILVSFFFFFKTQCFHQLHTHFPCTGALVCSEFMQEALFQHQILSLLSAVCFQGVYFSLYEVEISNKDQYKMDQLVEKLKEKDLVGFWGFFIAFMFSSEDGDDSDISLKIASVLPGLRYALQKATSSSWGDAVSTSLCIKQHFQEYAKLDQNTQPTSGQNCKVPLSSLLSPTEDECTDPFKKHSEQSFSQLQHYLSDPSSYTLEMSAALGCLTGAVQSLCCESEANFKVDFCSAVPPDPISPNTAAEIKVKSENPQKKWSPLKMQMHPMGDSSRNRKATKKKKINIAFSFPKKPGFAASSNEPMLKLANLQFPHRRKRGAEVLSAEFVHKAQSEPVQKETSAPDDPGLQTKRLKILKNPDMKKVPVAETVTKPVKSKTLKSVANSPSKPQAKKQAESGKSAVSYGQTSEIYPGGVPDLGFVLKGNNYESHALNLLADLALGSCIPSFIPRGSGMIAVSCSPSSNSAKEQQSHRKHRSLRVASDHEYHRVDKLAKGATCPSKKSPGIFSKKNNASPSPAKPHALPPRETQEAAEANKHSFISAEHSYASQMPEHSKKHMYPRGAPYPGPAPSRNGTRNARAGPLVGKVLPFRHQQSSTHLQRPFEAMAMRRRSNLLSPRLKEDFAKSHTVNICGESVKVTCHWEAEYLFNLDSRYTNDALEKTVIRALHGPWDPDLPDDVEEMKLILHMWVALFYSKPSKLLSSTRKVVEHSNPEKYVSINSTGDFLELSDDGEDCFGLETCPADSRSDPDQTPSSSLDRSTHCQGCFCPEESPADSQTDDDGTPGVVDKTSLHHLLKSEPSSSVREGMSAMKEHPRQQQSSPNSLSPPVHRGSAPASPLQQDPLPHGGDADPPPHLLEQSEQGPILYQHGRPCEHVGAADVSVAAKSPDGSLKPRCAEEVKKDVGPCHAEPAKSSPVDALVPRNSRSVPPSASHNHKADLHNLEPDSVLSVHPELCSPSVSLAPDGAPRSCCMGQLPPAACSGYGSPGGQAADVVGSREKEPVPHEDLEGGSSIPLANPASFSAGELLMPLCKPQSVCNQGEHEAKGSDVFVDLHHASVEVGEGEIPTLPFPLPSKDRRMGLTSEDLSETFSSDSDQESFGETSRSLLTARSSYRSVDAAGARTNCDSSSASVVHVEGRSEDWGSLGAEGGCSQAQHGWLIDPGEASSGHIPQYVNIRDSQGNTKDYRNFVVTKKCQERMGNLQPSKRHRHCAGQPHLLRSLKGTWRGFEEITQHTLDMECLRFHYKLKQILRSGKPPFSTSKSIFPQDFSPQAMSETLPVREAPVPLSPRSRSPLQVTILPSDTWPSGLGWHQRSSWQGDPCTPWQDTLCDERSRARSRTTSQGRAAPFHLGKLKYDDKLKDSRGDIAVILDEYAEFNRVMLSRADAGSEGGGPVPAQGEAVSEWTCASLPGRMAAFKEMIEDLYSALRFHLRSVAKEACGHAGMFYLVETGKDPFFARVKTLLKKDGHMEIEPLSFCEAEHLDTDRLLVVIRNEDISSHIHNQVPCLLKLKHCPNVAFAGVDSPKDITGHTYQELFHTGGFVVSDNEVLETVTLGQLKEVVKVLEKLNRSGRWKWFLHYKESKKLREDVSRVDADARKKHLILKSCQGADLIEVLHYHACDSGLPPKSEYVKCLLNLQVQHVSARFAVYLTEKPSVSREVLESKGILVADVNAFLGTVQKAAAPFRRSYW